MVGAVSVAVWRAAVDAWYDELDRPEMERSQERRAWEWEERRAAGVVYDAWMVERAARPEWLAIAGAFLVVDTYRGLAGGMLDEPDEMRAEFDLPDDLPDERIAYHYLTHLHVELGDALAMVEEHVPVEVDE